MDEVIKIGASNLDQKYEEEIINELSISEVI